MKTKEQYSVDIYNFYWNKPRTRQNYIEFCRACIGYENARIDEVLESKKVDAIKTDEKTQRLVDAVNHWAKCDEKMARYGAGAIVEIDGVGQCVVDEAWDNAKASMIRLADECYKEE